jgi:hypothetical protein
VKACHKEG